LLSFAHCTKAQAQTPTVSWEAPASCPKPTALGDFRETQTGSALTASVSIHDEGSEWHAELHTLQQGRRGQRHLVAASCEELSRAVEVVLSLVASDDIGENEGVSETRPQTMEAPAPSDETTTPSVYSERTVAPARVPLDSTPAPSRTAPPFVAGTFGRLAASLGWVEGSTFGAGAQLAATHYEASWGGEIALQGTAPWATPEGDNGAAIDMQFYELAALGCHRWTPGALFAICAGPRLELVRGRASEVEAPSNDFALLPGVGVGVRMRGSARARVSWKIGADAHVRLRAAHFNDEPDGQVLTLSPFGARFVTGPDISF
jgi:hypothetical protein